ncbi:MAG: hypothetical protein HQ481_14000, partial [Alphaproteobacteria bacterium]|nr:hypothetical protein [Alphaproteobacteria bacterium]
MKARPLWNAKANGWVFSKKREAEVRERVGAAEQVAVPTVEPKPVAAETKAAPERRQVGTNVDGNSAAAATRPKRFRDAPVPLMQFIRDQGGIDPSDPMIGDIRTILDAQAFQMLRRPTASSSGTAVGGKRLDRLREAAEEAGYIPEDSTIADFLDAIRSDAFAQAEGRSRTYAAEDVGDAAARGLTAREARQNEQALARFPSLDVARAYVENTRDLQDAIAEADRRLDEIEADIDAQVRAVLDEQWSPAERPDDAEIPFAWNTEKEGSQFAPASESAPRDGGRRSDTGGQGQADRTREDAADGRDQTAPDSGGREALETERTDQGEQILAPGVEPAAEPMPPAAPEQAASPAATLPAGYGANNKLVTSDRADEARRKLRAKLKGQLNAGIDPEIMAEGAILAVYHVEAGARKFGDFASAIIADLGDAAKPFLKLWYNAARDYPGVVSGDMTPYAEVAATDLDAMLQGSDTGTVATTTPSDAVTPEATNASDPEHPAAPRYDQYG